MLDIVFDIIKDVLIMPITFAISLIISVLKMTERKRKYRKILRYAPGDEEVVCFTANPGQYDDEECVTLGYVFEYMSVGVITSSLKKIYKDLNFTTMMSQLDYANIRKKNLKRNLILIGGPFHNTVTRELLFSNNINIPFTFDDSANLIYTDENGRQTKFCPEMSKGEHKFFEKDYALIMNIKNPLEPQKRILSIIGCRSVGCYGAALFLCNNIHSLKRKIVDEEYAIVISCDGEEENITSEPVFEAYYKLDTQANESKLPVYA